MSTGTAEQFVWQKWRRVWYMGRIVDESPAPAASASDTQTPRVSTLASSSSSSGSPTVRVHIHGELETNDKRFPRDSPNLVQLAVVPSPVAAIGTFPTLHACVELLLMDAHLYDLLLQQHAHALDAHLSSESSDRVPCLVGRVVQVLPAHDASVVDVAYPTAYHDVVHDRRVHIGNGYLRVIPDDEFERRHERLAQTLAAARTAPRVT